MAPALPDASATVWERIVRRPGTWTDVAGRCGEAHRAYHTLEHVDEVLAVLAGLGVTDAGVLLAAILHDVVYDPRRHDNEARSAEYATDVLRHLDGDVVTRTHRLILATATHVAPAGLTGSDMAMLDADLAVLGAAPERYDRYAAGIRSEYRDVPDDAFTGGRRRVLEDFLGRPRLFVTDALHERLDAPARANLRRELARLGGNGASPA